MARDALETIWYFADGDVERGPVTELQIRALIGTGNLTRGDLVWKEGMEDWTPAGEVPGLFEELPAASEKKPARESSARRAEAGEPPAVPLESVPPRPLAAVGAAFTLDVTRPLPVFRYATFAGQPLLLAGLLLMLFARGCDSLGNRYAARLAARAEALESQFNDRCYAEKQPLEQRLQELLDKQNPSAEDQSERRSVDERLRKLDESKASEEAQLRDGVWREAARAAQDAAAAQPMWQFWREGAFWLGLLLLSGGLLVLGLAGDTVERWLGLVLLTLVVAFLLIGPQH